MISLVNPKESPLGMGLIGYGYWGPNLARNINLSNATVNAICDKSPLAQQKVEQQLSNVPFFDSIDELLKAPHIDAVFVATPASTHYELARKSLLAGKHVFVEKPLTDNSDDARRLVDLAAAKNLILMTDHTYIYHGGIKKIKEILDKGEMGEIKYLDSVRINLGLFQNDVNVIWDLAVHDFSIMDYLIDKNPLSISASSIRHVMDRPESMAYITCFFEKGLIAHFHVNWLAPVKVRRTLIGGLNQMIMFDELEPDEKVRVYDRGVELEVKDESKHEVLVSYRTGDMYAPKLDRTEALSVVVSHFIDCIKSGKNPKTDGESGYRVIRMLEATEKSVRNNGARIELEWDN